MFHENILFSIARLSESGEIIHKLDFHKINTRLEVVMTSKRGVISYIIVNYCRFFKFKYFIFYFEY